MTKGSANRIARFRLVARIERLVEVPGTYLAVVFAVGLAVELVLSAQGAAVPEVLGWLLLRSGASSSCSSCSASSSAQTVSCICAAC